MIRGTAPQVHHEPAASYPQQHELLNIYWYQDTYQLDLPEYKHYNVNIILRNCRQELTLMSQQEKPASENITQEDQAEYEVVISGKSAYRHDNEENA